LGLHRGVLFEALYDELVEADLDVRTNTEIVRLTDDARATTALHDGKEVSWARVESCLDPALQIDDVTPTSAALHFFASQSGEPLSEVSVDGVAAHATMTGNAIALSFGSLPKGKRIATVHAKDARGKEARARGSRSGPRTAPSIGGTRRSIK
jgi:hypothetical protein